MWIVSVAYIIRNEKLFRCAKVSVQSSKMVVLVRASKWSRIFKRCQWSLLIGTFENATQNWRIAFVELTLQWTLFPQSFFLWGIRILLGSAVPLLPSSQIDDESFLFISCYLSEWMPCIGIHRKPQETEWLFLLLLPQVAFTSVPFQTVSRNKGF